jgi:uncharacterized protein with HEPN domain
MPPDSGEHGGGTPQRASRSEGSRDAALLLDMLTAARLVAAYVAGKNFDDYLGDQMLRDAVERRVEIIGEAARGVSAAFKAAHPVIPWRPIMAQRHILAHEYATVRNDVIWKVATVHVPALIALLEPMIPPVPPARET